MPMSRKDKKRMAIYAAGAAGAALRGGIHTAYYITKLGLAAGTMLSQIVLGGSVALADQICGTHSSTHVGDTMASGLSKVLNGAADFGDKHLSNGVTSLETYIKKKIMRSH